MKPQPVKLIFPDGLERRFTSMSSAAGWLDEVTVTDISSALHCTEGSFTPDALKGVEVLTWEGWKPPVREWVVLIQGKVRVDQKLTAKLRNGRRLDCKHHYVIVKAVSIKQAIFLAANGMEYNDTKHIGITSVHLGEES